MNIKELLKLPANHLKRVVALKAQIEQLEAQLENIVAGASPAPIAAAIRTRRKMSAEARRKISLAAKARWAKIHAAKKK